MRYSMQSILLAVFLVSLVTNAIRLHCGTRSFAVRTARIELETAKQQDLNAIKHYRALMQSPSLMLSNEQRALQAERCNRLLSQLQTQFDAYATSLPILQPKSDQISVRSAPTVDSLSTLPIGLRIKTADLWEVNVPADHEVMIRIDVFDNSTWHKLNTGLNQIKFTNLPVYDANPESLIHLNGKAIVAFSHDKFVNSAPKLKEIWKHQPQIDFNADQELPVLLHVTLDRLESVRIQLTRLAD